MKMPQSYCKWQDFDDKMVFWGVLRWGMGGFAMGGEVFEREARVLTVEMAFL